jgi:hypothetical protein
MRYVSPSGWRIAIPSYFAVGLLAGAGWAQHLAARAWKSPGLGTFTVINLVLPFAAAAVALAFPRWWTAVVGALLLTAGESTATMCRVFTPRFWDWTAAMWWQATHPIQIPATVGYALVGCLVVGMARPWRRVGKPRDERLCECGYPRCGLEGAPCPECGRGPADISREPAQTRPRGL